MIGFRLFYMKGGAMENKQLYNERRELFNNAFELKPNKRTPIFSNFWTGKLLDQTEHSLKEVLSDYDLLEKTICDFQDTYNFDSHFDLGTRNPIRVVKALGVEGFHRISDDDFVNVVDHHIMEGDEYKEYVENPNKFFYSKVFQRYCPDLTIGQLQEASREYADFMAFTAKITKKFAEEYECVPVSPLYIKEPLEYFINSLRGIKELSIDIRRNQEELLAALDAIYETIMLPGMDRVIATDTSQYLGDAYTSFMAWSILNEKQFAKFYWPYFIKCFDKMIGAGKKLFFMSESTLLRFEKFFQDIPAGHLMIQLEQDDIFEVRKKLPQLALAGGMSPELLGHGTKEECVDYAKKLIDELGPGFVLSQTKMMSYRADCKGENLKAVNDFARTYTL